MASRWSSVREAVLHNKGKKIVALFLALVTWYAIQAAISFETVISDVPLVVEADPGWAVLDRSARTVDILFRGPQEEIRYLDGEQVKVELDIRGKTFEGSAVFKVTARNVKAPGTVRPVLIRPDEITLKLDREMEKQVPVKADLQGVPPEGYEVEKWVAAPASVTVHGPRQRLDEIDAVRTRPIDLEGRSRSFKKLKVPVTPPGEAWVARIAPSNVMVEITIVERSATKDVGPLAVDVLVPPGPRLKVQVRPEDVTVTVRGRAELLKGLAGDDVRAYVDCGDLEAGSSYDLPVRVQLPSGVGAVGIEPPTVKVTIEEL